MCTSERKRPAIGQHQQFTAAGAFWWRAGWVGLLWWPLGLLVISQLGQWPWLPRLAGPDCFMFSDVAMAFGLIGLRIAGVEVDDPGVVSKSWPGYWDMLRELQ